MKLFENQKLFKHKLVGLSSQMFFKLHFNNNNNNNRIKDLNLNGFIGTIKLSFDHICFYCNNTSIIFWNHPKNKEKFRYTILFMNRKQKQLIYDI